jgi:phospholipase C
MIDPNGTGGGPVIDNTEPSKGFTWTTYAEMLQNAGVSWKVYQQTDNYDDNALAWFANFINAKPGNPLYDRGMVKSSDVVSEFQTDITNGTLPTVSWIIAPAASSEHPSYSPASGEALTK